jgi:hypothetical protein
MPLGCPMVDFINIHPAKPALRLRDVSSRTRRATQFIPIYSTKILICRVFTILSGGLRAIIALSMAQKQKSQGEIL